jgi:hypothetical protein
MEVFRTLKKIIAEKPECFQQYLDILGLYWNAWWRRERDSNPRYLAVNTLSKRAP